MLSVKNNEAINKYILQTMSTHSLSISMIRNVHNAVKCVLRRNYNNQYVFVSVRSCLLKAKDQSPLNAGI